MNQNANIQNVLPFPYRKIILKISYAFRKWGWGEGGDKVAHLVGKSYLASENNFEGYKGFLLSIVSLQGFFSEAAPEHRIQEIKEKQVCKFPMGICHLLWFPQTDKKEKKIRISFLQSCFNMSKRHPHLLHCPHTSLIGALVGFALGGNSKRTISNYLQSWAWPQVVSLSDGSELQNWEESGHISRVTPLLGMRLGNIHSGLSALGTAQRMQNANAATPAGF